ncbi:AraC family transcriptional regulator [Paenibacillus arenilitoris]|uniref:AraC family transcriptional regulator n=1 Tax=Paenibacillus arenilitoris TaxID=2772299 RepID=A0A927H783_9BACL|nr:helix-turn-helix domain-containing protein [Paenibacillus arenilitoris]MBD2869329.1 AraC family transcriptional regulator [Paenibacillus arenilitoris]
MKRNWYRRMLLSYFPIFMFTVTILIFLSFIVVNDISHKETVKADRIKTDYMADRLSRSLKGIELDVLEEVEKNDRYRDFLNVGLTGENSQVIFDVVDSMRALADSDSLLDSIYVYRNEDKQVLTRSGLVSWEAFADRAFVEHALANPDIHGWSELRSYHEFSTEKDKRVISVYKREPLPFGTEGLVVINVDMYAVEQMIRSMNNGELSFVDVRDASGTLLFSTSSADRTEGDEAGGKVLNRIPFGLTGWTFESGIAAGQLFMWVSVISYVWIVIGVLTVAFAIFYIIYITRKNYKPIRVMMNRIESIQLREDAFGRKMDELSMIDHTLESLIQQTADFEKQQRENLLVSRRQLFHDLMQGEGAANAQERLTKLGLLPAGEKPEQLAFVVVEIGRYRDFRSDFSSRDQHTLKFALTNVLQELAQADGMYGWAEWIAENRMGLIVGLGADRPDARRQIRQFADKGRLWAAEHLRLSLLFGVGNAVREWERIGESCKSAVDALRHKMSLGKQAVVMSEDLPDAAGRKWYAYVQHASGLVKEFRLLTGQWRAQLDMLFAHMEKDCMKDEDIRTVLQTMMDMLGSELAEMSEELRVYFKGPEAGAIVSAADETATLEELKALYSERLTEVYRIYVSHSETKNHRAMITELKSYIEENFENPDLSLKHLSDRFHISGKYASYLFKEEFNMKFVDFIVQLRMERAEELLAETEEPVQSIALKVGYANAITFGRVFKRVVGVTPGDYRKLKFKPGKARHAGDI